MSESTMTIAVVTGEASGELLAVDLITQLKSIQPNLHIVAVGGDRMASLNVEMLMDNAVFQVMGLVEILSDLPRLLKAKNRLVKILKSRQIDLYIGIDSPELNFTIAKKLRQSNIPVMHYVSPSVWAWRPKRVYKMARYIDYLLTLFPFEADLYRKTSIKTYFVGHPLAKQIPVLVDKVQHKSDLGIDTDAFTLAVLPGSRMREIKTLMPIFAETVRQLVQPNWQILSAAVSPDKQQQANQISAQYGLTIQWFDDSQAVLKAADFAVVGSGTVALEAMLCKTPMVVAYKIATLSYHIVRLCRMMQLPYFSLPNVLYGDFLVPEVMQNDLTVEQLLLTCQQVLHSQKRQNLVAEFSRIHRQLLPPQNQQAGQVVADVLEAL